MTKWSQATASAKGFQRSILFGSLGTAIAVILRLSMPAEVGGEQAIFSYPAIVIVTLLFGVGAGAVVAVICFCLLWYYVIPPYHSFRLSSSSAAITLVVYGIVGVSLIWTISSMRRALESFRGLSDKLQSLVEQRTKERNRVWERSRELVVIVEHNDCVSSANPALCHLFNLDDTTLRQTNFESLLVDADQPAYRQARDGRNGVFEARLVAPGGVVWVSWSIVQEGDCFYLVGRDFTAEHRCDEMLQQSQKMELVGQMAGGLAHDFGNLLPPISMTLHLLQKRYGDDDRTRGLIKGAEESVGRADHLIKRLLELSKPSRLEPRAQATLPLLDQIVPLLREALGSRELRLSLDLDLPDIRVDANQLDMALLNLVLNARDATTDEGILELCVKKNGFRTVAIILSDDGSGMDAEVLAKATEPFFSTKPSGEGTGLGLSMVHNFALAAGGCLVIESSKGVGTRAVISLPSEPARVVDD